MCVWVCMSNIMCEGITMSCLFVYDAVRINNKKNFHNNELFMVFTISLYGRMSNYGEACDLKYIMSMLSHECGERRALDCIDVIIQLRNYSKEMYLFSGCKKSLHIEVKIIADGFIE